MQAGKFRDLVNDAKKHRNYENKWNPFRRCVVLVNMVAKNILPFRHSKNVQFESLIKPHLKRLYSLAYRFTGQRSDAEDLVQDVLIKLFPRLEEMQTIEKLSPWLARVLYRHFIDVLRSKNRSLVDLLDDDSFLESIAVEDQGPEQNLDLSQTQNRLQYCLNKLNEDQRLIVILHDVEGYTLQEIHFLNDVSIGTLKSRLNRARGRLRDLLKKMEPLVAEKRVNE